MNSMSRFGHLIFIHLLQHSDLAQGGKAYLPLRIRRVGLSLKYTALSLAARFRDAYGQKSIDINIASTITLGTIW